MSVTAPTILYFSRGRGHGHAIPDMAIADSLQRVLAPSKIIFASYSTGHQTLVANKREVINMNLPEANPYFDTLISARQIIAHIKPVAVVCDEEFAALPACHIASVPVVFTSHWFPSDSLREESLAYANALVINDYPGLFRTPSSLQKPPVFVGPVVRRMLYDRGDRDILRGEFGIPRDTLVVAVVPGGHSNEAEAPVLDTILSAFTYLPNPKRLMWIGGRDIHLVRYRTRSLLDVETFDYFNPIEKLLSICDVVITKGTRGVTLEATFLRIPTISVSFGLNPIDDVCLSRFPSNIAVNGRALDGKVLSDLICSTRHLRVDSHSFQFGDHTNIDGEATAGAIAHEIRLSVGAFR